MGEILWQSISSIWCHVYLLRDTAFGVVACYRYNFQQKRSHRTTEAAVGGGEGGGGGAGGEEGGGAHWQNFGVRRPAEEMLSPSV